MIVTINGRASLVGAELSVADMLSLYSQIIDELRSRNVVRSSNNPLSDYAELLFCKAFGWLQENNAAAGHDATDTQKNRYQIKGRRLTAHNVSRQLSAIRDLESTPFDYLCGLIVDNGFKIIRAAIVPVSIVKDRATFVARTNSWRFLLHDDVWNLPNVRDVTTDLRAVAEAL